MKSNRTLRLAHFVLTILLICLGLFYGIVAYLTAWGSGPLSRSDLFPNDLLVGESTQPENTQLSGTICIAIVIILGSFLGCAGGYRQTRGYLIAFDVALGLGMILQLGFGIRSIIHLKSASDEAQALWDTAPSKDTWMNVFQCCSFNSDFQCATDIVNDCQESMVDALTNQYTLLAILYFIFGTLTTMGFVITLVWILKIGDQKRPKDIYTKEDFNMYVLDPEVSS